MENFIIFCYYDTEEKRFVDMDLSITLNNDNGDMTDRHHEALTTVLEDCLNSEDPIIDGLKKTIIDTYFDNEQRCLSAYSSDEVMEKIEKLKHEDPSDVETKYLNLPIEYFIDNNIPPYLYQKFIKPHSILDNIKTMDWDYSTLWSLLPKDKEIPSDVLSSFSSYKNFNMLYVLYKCKTNLTKNNIRYLFLNYVHYFMTSNILYIYDVRKKIKKDLLDLKYDDNSEEYLSQPDIVNYIETLLSIYDVCFNDLSFYQDDLSLLCTILNKFLSYNIITDTYEDITLIKEEYLKDIEFNEDFTHIFYKEDVPYFYDKYNISEINIEELDLDDEEYDE